MLLPPALPSIPQSFERAIQLIVVHCSATPSGRWLRGAPGSVNHRTPVDVIDDWHRARGFGRKSMARSRFNWRLASIGYHYVIDLDGRVHTGRHPEELGAHVAGHNTGSLGICLVGGAEPQARYTPAQWGSLTALLLALQLRLGDVQPRVCGHRDLSPDGDGDGVVKRHEWLKTCPGFSVAAWLAGGMQPLEGHVYTEPAG